MSETIRVASDAAGPVSLLPKAKSVPSDKIYSSPLSAPAQRKESGVSALPESMGSAHPPEGAAVDSSMISGVGSTTTVFALGAVFLMGILGLRLMSSQFAFLRTLQSKDPTHTRQSNFSPFG